MRKTKAQKGITLVALVITIIVLLILAVVAIGAVRDSGIIGHAQNSADKYNTEKDKEESMLGQYEDEISKYYSSNGNVDTDGEGGEIVSNAPEELKKYVLGSDFKGRPIQEIFDWDEHTFINDSNTSDIDETQIFDMKFYDVNYDLFFDTASIYFECNGKVYRLNAVYDSENDIWEDEAVTESIVEIYAPQGNEGKIVKYDSNGDGTKEEWTIITDRDGKLEIVSNVAMGNLKLGIQSPYLPAKVGDLDGNGISEDNIDKAIYSYNNAIATINDYCKTQVTTKDNGGVRSLGASSETNKPYSTEYFDSKFKGSGIVKAGDMSFEEDYAKLNCLGILDIGESYWIASREDQPYDDSEPNFGIRAITYDKDGSRFWAPTMCELHHTAGWTKTYSYEYKVRPVVINPQNIEY